MPAAAARPTASTGMKELVATNVSRTAVKGSGHWLIEEATDQVVPAIVAFVT